MDRPELALKGFRRERGLLWPENDVRCAEVTFEEIASSWPKVLEYAHRRGIAVQAGGNCGQLVQMVAREFASVYTFEPDPMNFTALAVNTSGLMNVARFQCALGDARQRGDLRGMKNGDEKFPQNCGALYMEGKGSIPTITIDDLGLSSCDLIALDIEGAEASALRGAENTISLFRPIIVIEEKGLGEKFFREVKNAAENYLISRHHYERADKIKYDLVMVPR